MIPAQHGEEILSFFPGHVVPANVLPVSKPSVKWAKVKILSIISNYAL